MMMFWLQALFKNSEQLVKPDGSTNTFVSRNMEQVGLVKTGVAIMGRSLNMGRHGRFSACQLRDWCDLEGSHYVLK